jgi:hypothetical protein
MQETNVVPWRSDVDSRGIENASTDSPSGQRDSLPSLVEVVLRRKLSRGGAASLTDVEWHLLRVTTLLHAVHHKTLEHFLNEIPLAELRGIALGLEAIGAGDASMLIHFASREIDATNAMGAARDRPAAIRRTAAWLDGEFGPRRNSIELKMIEFVFEQPDPAPAEPEPAAAQIALDLAT